MYNYTRSGDVSKSDDDSENCLSLITTEIIWIMYSPSDMHTDIVSYDIIIIYSMKILHGNSFCTWFYSQCRDIHKIKNCTCKTFLNLLNSIERYNILKTGLLLWIF